jgi:hypothetical protein
MFRHHRVGVTFGVLFVALVGGLFGYAIGATSPSTIFGLSNPTAEVVGAITLAAFAGIVWSIGEAIVGLVGAIGRDATLVRLGVSLVGSLISVVSSGLHLIDSSLFPANPHSILAYGPLASGIGAIALGAHALLHQIRLDRLAKLGMRP